MGVYPRGRALMTPQLGELTMGIELDAYPQLVILKRTRVLVRVGLLNRPSFSRYPELKQNLG